MNCEKVSNENRRFLNLFFTSFRAQLDFMKNSHLPKMLAIEVPSDCYPDYNCVFCHRKDNEEKPVDLRGLEERLKLNRKLDINMLVIAGSEPFNHPQIMDIIGICSEYFSQISAFGLVERLKDMSFVKKIKKAGITEISLPLYSADEKIHNAIVGKDNFQDTLASIHNLKKNDIKTFLHSVMLKSNIAALPATEQYAKRLKLPFITIPFRPKKGLNEQELLVGYSDMIAFLKDKNIMSLVGFPLCVQKEIQKKSVSHDNISGIMKLYILLQKFHKLKICRGCKEYSHCSGFFMPFEADAQSGEIHKLTEIKG